MKLTIRASLAFVVSLVLTSCATPYAPIGASGGYEHQQLAETVYSVRFMGNGFTDAQRAADFALLRAAEIGKQLGFTHMVLRGSQDQGGSETMYTGTTTTVNPYGGAAYSTPQYQTVYKPGKAITVEYFDGVPNVRALDVFQVDEVVTRLRAQYKLDKK